MRNKPAPSDDGFPKATEPSRVAAVIVLYNPQARLLERLLETLTGQVERTIVIDNSPQPRSEYPDLFAARGAYYQALGENTGIATAQNIGIQRALEEQCSHVLLLDQDSALPAGMVDQLLKAENELIADGAHVAAVGPAFRDEKTGHISPAIRQGILHVKRLRIDDSFSSPVESDYLIASGSLIRMSVIQQIGGMRDELFIDWVDIEWGLRARAHGLKSFMVPGVVMAHSIGDAWITVMGRQISLHSDVRHYYIVRNAAYLLRFAEMGWRWRLLALVRIPEYVVLFSLHAADVPKSFRLLFKAVQDGLLGRIGPLK